MHFENYDNVFINVIILLKTFGCYTVITIKNRGINFNTYITSKITI